MIKLIQGDTLEILKTLGPETVDCVVTSPPYWNLRDYGTANWVGGDKNCSHKSAKLKSRYDYSLDASPIQKPRKGTDAPRYMDICPDCGAKKVDLQLGLEPTFQEYINKLCNIFDEVKRVLKKSGTCWVNLGDTYSGNKKGKTDAKVADFVKASCIGIHKKAVIKEKCLCQIPFRFSIEMTNRGWILRNVLIWHKPNCMPSSVKDRFTVDFEYLFFFVKNKKYYFEQQFEPTIEPYSEKKAKRPPTSKMKADYIDGRKAGNFTYNKLKPQGRNKRCVWKISTKPFEGAHFAVFPEKLVETPIKAGCPKGGVVLDPFCGAGTTGVVAAKLGRGFIGIDLNPEYLKMAERRINKETQQGRFL